MKLWWERFQRGYLSGLDASSLFTHRTAEVPSEFKHLGVRCRVKQTKFPLEGLFSFRVLVLEGTTPWASRFQDISLFAFLDLGPRKS